MFNVISQSKRYEAHPRLANSTASAAAECRCQVRTFRSNTKWRLLPLSVAAWCAWAAVATDNEMFVASGFRLLSVLI